MGSEPERATEPLTVVPSRIEAELIVGLLRDNDLTAVTSPDDLGGLNPAMAEAEGVRVLVAPGDVAAARLLLAQAAEGAPDDEDDEDDEENDEQ